MVHVDLATLMPLYDYRQRDNLLNYGQTERERESDSDCLREWKWVEVVVEEEIYMVEMGGPWKLGPPTLKIR